MPQVDLEALVSVCGGSDRKIACESVDGDDHDITQIQPDFPPESFWLSKDAEIDWFDRNAFLERKESTKGNTIPTNSNHSNSNSQRFSHSLKSKAAMIGLPKTQKNNYGEKLKYCKPANVRLFPPKRSQSGGKSTAQMAEPSSPKVSCMGRVRSKRSRRCKPSQPETKPAKPVERTKSNRGNKKKGFCSNLMSLFRSDRRRRDNSIVNTEASSSIRSSSRNKKTSKRSEIQVSNEPDIAAPGLGGMTRFVSGRRSESWSAEDGDVARHSVDSERSGTLERSGSRRRN